MQIRLKTKSEGSNNCFQSSEKGCMEAQIWEGILWRFLRAQWPLYIWNRRCLEHQHSQRAGWSSDLTEHSGKMVFDRNMNKNPAVTVAELQKAVVGWENDPEGRPSLQPATNPDRSLSSENAHQAPEGLSDCENQDSLTWLLNFWP